MSSPPAASATALGPISVSGHRQQPLPLRERDATSGSLSELQKQVVQDLEREMRALGASVQRDVREELRRWLAEQPALAGAGTPGGLGAAADRFAKRPPPLHAEHLAVSEVEPLFVADLKAAKGDNNFLADAGSNAATASRGNASLPGMVEADSVDDPSHAGTPDSPAAAARAAAAAATATARRTPPKKPEAVTNVSGPPHQPQKLWISTEVKPMRVAFGEDSDSSEEGKVVSGQSSRSRIKAQDAIVRSTSSGRRTLARGAAEAIAGRSRITKIPGHQQAVPARLSGIDEKLRGTRKLTLTTVWKKYKADGEKPGLSTLCMCLVTSNYFDYCMGLVLLANAATIGIQANYFAGLASTGEKDIPLTFRVVDAAFCILFTIELISRMVAFQLSFFSGLGWKWNWFDTMIVFFQILDELVKLFFTNSSVQDGLDKVGVIRMLRLARLMRLVRMVRLIPELKSMVYLIAASIGSFFWSLILILIMIYCYAIYYTEIATGMIQEGKISEEEFESAQNVWGGVFQSVLSLWMAITGGDDWRNFSDFFQADDGYALHILFFVIYIAFATLVMLNLVTGVFVEGAQRIIKEDKDAELLNMAAKIFDRLAADGDGVSQDMVISPDDFQELCESGQMDDYMKAIGISSDDSSHLYSLLDTNKTGVVSVAEFVSGCLRLRGNAKSLDMAEMECTMHNHFLKLLHKIDEVASRLDSHINRNNTAIREISAKGQANVDALRKIAEADIGALPFEEV